MNEPKYLTVTAITRYLKRKFDMDPHLQDIWIKGEISNFKWHSRGHMYFTLKDEKSRIQAVMFARDNRSLTFQVEDGMKVFIRGEVTVYEAYGQYQLYAKEMHLDGLGNLYLAFEQLKKRLEEEGLFSQEKKKKIPEFPEKIGVITSPTGAAIRDIITTIKRRYPIAQIIIFPVLVQGEEAAPSIVRAIKQANELRNIDVLIVGRGGGSIEDLWPFNEEIVARAIYESDIPIISAVGHETDYTIADFVADLRAPTPTGAAELAVPHIEELMEKIAIHRIRIYRAMQKKVNMEKKQLLHLQKSYAFRYPRQLIQQKEQSLDQLYDRFMKESERTVAAKKDQCKQMYNRLKQLHPTAQIKIEKEHVERLVHLLQKETSKHLREKQLLLMNVVSKLNALNPLKVMERGYSIVYGENDQLVKSVQQITPGDLLKLQLTDGYAECQVWGIEERESDE